MRLTVKAVAAWWKPAVLMFTALLALLLLLPRLASAPATPSRAALSVLPAGAAFRDGDREFNDANINYVAACGDRGADASREVDDDNACGCASNATLEQLTQRWRAAEYAVQVASRRERALSEALRVTSITNASSPDRMTWELPAPAAQLEAQLNATRAELKALQPELAQLRAAADAAWPPSDLPGFRPAPSNITALPDELLRPPESGCAASRLRGGARPHPTSPLPPGVFSRRVNVSFLLQYYNHPANMDAIVDTLYECTTGSAYGGPVAAGVQVGTTSELIVNVDSRGDGAAWDAAMNRTAAGSFLTVLLSINLHEVHGYNRAAAVARGDVLVLLQDDALPPTDCRWVADVLARFSAFPRLGAVGLNIADTWMPSAAHEAAGGAGDAGSGRMNQNDIWFRHQGVPFQFVTVADFSPFAVRASALAAVGGLDEGFAAPGECGIVTDYELSLRMWTAGWHVAHMALRGGSRAGIGTGGTHRSLSVGLKCWSRQMSLNYGVLGQRYSAADRAAIYYQKPESLWHRKTLLAVIAFSLSNSSMLVVNKAAINLLPVPSLVLTAQLAASALFVQAAATAGVIEADVFERHKIKAFFPAVCGFLAVLFCNAKVLEQTTVETFIVVRSSTPLVVAVLDWRFMGRELPDARSTAVLVVIFLSAVAYVQNVRISLGAACWALAWLSVFTFDQLYIKHICDTVPMSAWGRVKYSNALAVVPAILLGAAFGEYGVLGGYVVSSEAVAVLMLSCACGIALSYSAFHLRAQISATAFTVVGILCKLGSVLISTVVWSKRASPRGTAALMVCLLAGSAYRSAPLRATTAAAAKEDLQTGQTSEASCK